MGILNSASKIVFILLALSACGALFLGKIESKDFMLLAAMAFSFYFSNKGETSSAASSTTDTTSTTTTNTPPYLGK